MHKLWVLVLIAALGCSSSSKSNDGAKPDIPTQVDTGPAKDTATAGEDAGKVPNCVDQPKGTPCDDGDLCTLNDVCEQGEWHGWTNGVDQSAGSSQCAGPISQRN